MVLAYGPDGVLEVRRAKQILRQKTVDFVERQYDRGQRTLGWLVPAGGFRDVDEWAAAEQYLEELWTEYKGS